MGFKVFLIAASIAVSALLSTQDSFATNPTFGNNPGDDSSRTVKKVDIFQ